MPSKISMAARLSALVIMVAGLTLALDTLPVTAGGPITHYYIGRRSAEKIAVDSNAPGDLREILAGTDGQEAFASGAISPDLEGIKMKAHNGNETADLPHKMIAKAREDLVAAQSLPDSDPSKIQKLRMGQKELAFSYGWLSHVAADLDVHPLVNKVAGDAFAHGDTGKKMIHTAQEVQLDYYAEKGFREKGEKVSYDIPYSLLEEITGLTQEKLLDNVKFMRIKIIASVKAKDQVIVAAEDLTGKWEQAVENSIADTVRFVEKPETVQNWDIDCGRMTTEEFEALRDAAIAANGGELPKNWGAKYLEWFSKTKGLSGNKLKDALVLLENGKEPPPAPAKNLSVKVSRNHSRDIRVFVDGEELPYNKEMDITTGENHVIHFKVIPILYKGNDWLKYTEISQDTPYSCHYRFDDGKFPESGKASVVKGKFDWFGGGTMSQKDPYSSGEHPKIQADMYDWVAPEAKYCNEGDLNGMRRYTIYVSAMITWDQTKWDPRESHFEGDSLHGDLVQILVPPDR